MSRTIRYSEGADLSALRRQARKARQARRFPVRATVYSLHGEGWERVEVKA